MLSKDGLSLNLLRRQETPAAQFRLRPSGPPQGVYGYDDETIDRAGKSGQG